MITNNSIGTYGQLGNQMFQYAMLIGVGDKHGYRVIIDEDIDSKSHNNFSIRNIFDIKLSHFYHEAGIHTNKKYVEEQFHFDRFFFKKVADNMDFDGYFQTEKYFTHCSDLIRKEFTFKNDIIEKATTIISSLNKDRPIVSIHVRRGDYVDLPNHHPLCSPTYYASAVEYFENMNPQFIVISDDIEWCKTNLNIPTAYYTSNEQGVDMCLLSMSDHNIIANSTFSWWGAWLNNNPDKIVIAPKIWFGPAYSHFDTTDIYCNNWIQL
jgi:hypothetical protein